jgi:predicted thioesterase
MERCTVDGLQLYLASDQTAVGAQVDIRHLVPTPVGMEITVTCTLVKIDRRRLSFIFEVWDAVEKIGDGRYDCFVVDRSRQQQRLDAKLGHRKASPE